MDRGKIQRRRQVRILNSQMFAVASPRVVIALIALLSGTAISFQEGGTQENCSDLRFQCYITVLSGESMKSHEFQPFCNKTSIFIAMNIQTLGVAVKAVKWAALTTMGGGYRYYLMGLFCFRMDYRCTLLLAVGNQKGFFIMDVSRPLKQSGLDSSFNSGLTVVSLKKEGKKPD